MTEKTPYDQEIHASERDLGPAFMGNIRAQILYAKREGYLAAVADYADLLAVATDAYDYFSALGDQLPQSHDRRKSFSQREPLALRDRLKNAIAKGKEVPDAPGR